MPIPLSAIAVEEKNKLATDSAWLIFLEIIIPGEAQSLYLARNNENIVWDGHTWIAFPFDVEQIKEGANEVPQTVLRVSNVSLYMRRIVRAYDYFIKTSGLRLIETKFYILNTDAIAADANCEPEDVYVFQISHVTVDALWVTFTLSAMNPYKRRFPQHRVMKDGCRFVFKGQLCGYTGNETECDRTLKRCRELTRIDPATGLEVSQSERFGAFPGVGLGGIVVTSR
ncbi:MAG TPA: hypothetical protein VLL97_08905 [Acidobacteriota bacterium]|nr:hypothetical protein [Acidobacteriota bacterium]